MTTPSYEIRIPYKIETILFYYCIQLLNLWLKAFSCKNALLEKITETLRMER